MSGCTCPCHEETAVCLCEECCEGSNAAVLAERERCAKIAEVVAEDRAGWPNHGTSAVHEIAEKIRSGE